LASEEVSSRRPARRKRRAFGCFAIRCGVANRQPVRANACGRRCRDADSPCGTSRSATLSRPGRVGIKEERLESAARLAGGLAVQRAGAVLPHRSGQNHIGRQIAARTENARHDAATCGFTPSALNSWPSSSSAGRFSCVRARLVGKLANERYLVHHPRHQREMFADLDAVDVGLGRLNLPRTSAARVRLHVQVSTWRGADEENSDAIADRVF